MPIGTRHRRRKAFGYVTREVKNDVSPFKTKTTWSKFSQQVDLIGLRVKSWDVILGVSLEGTGNVRCIII